MTDIPCDFTFDSIQIGQKKNFSQIITKSLIDDFAKISGDFNPLHMNDEYASDTIFEKRVCHGMLLASFFSKLIGMYLPGKNALYFSQSLQFKSGQETHSSQIICSSQLGHFFKRYPPYIKDAKISMIIVIKDNFFRNLKNDLKDLSRSISLTFSSS